MIDEAFVEARQNGWPLDKKEILQRQIEREDRERHRNFIPAELPKYKRVSWGKWSATALHVFGKQIIREGISLARP